MLWRILQSHGGTLPENVLVSFANTGDEHPATLDFVNEVSQRWSVPVVWLEYADHAEPQSRWKITSYEMASRDGEPYDAMLKRRGNYLPNPVQRFCTQALKLFPLHQYLRSLGWDEWLNVGGLRADEPSRLAKMRIPREKTPEETRVAPLAEAGVTRLMVSEFWKSHDFDLLLPNIDGRNPLGNCIDCFLKDTNILLSNYRRGWKPVRFMAREANGARFHKDRPSYARLYEFALSHDDLFPEGDSLEDCACTD
jgi:3'-phosphoadenosine 5'-phosphosulfate sulfotransferase (PAPS reductase)/FAD synthetase